MMQINYKFNRDICSETVKSIYDGVMFEQPDLCEEFDVNLNDNNDTISYCYDEDLADELYGSEAYLSRLNELGDELEYQIKYAGLDPYNDVQVECIDN